MAKTEKIFSLEQSFKDLQNGMLNEFNTTKNLTHPTSKGDSFEISWLDMFKKYLPERYCAEKAFVIDSEGNCSDQIDIVIFDRHFSPFLFNKNGVYYIPAESVYCVFEVKPEVTSETITYAGNKFESVKKLKRTSAPIYHAGGVISDPKAPIKITTGLLAGKSSYSDPFGESFLQNVRALKDLKSMNFVCTLENGSFFVDNEEDEIISSTDTALIFFFLKMLETLQKQGTVTAMEINKYYNVLKK